LKFNRGVMKRLEVAEKILGSTRQAKCVVKDFDGCYFGECGFDLSQEQFESWVKLQERDVEITVLKYTVDGGNFLGKTVLNGLAEAEKKTDLPPKESC